MWAFHNKVTGLIQAVSSNPTHPPGITVAGKTYEIETASDPFHGFLSVHERKVRL